MDYNLLILNDIGEYQQAVSNIDSLLSRELRLKPQWTFTEDEKVILINLPEKYKWITRDKSGRLYIYKYKPRKAKEIWSDSSFYHSLQIFQNIFQSIQWSDEEPCEFRRYL